jgi:hypothetical protein
MDYRNFDLSRGNSNFDVRHRFVAAAVYELPLARNRRGALHYVLGGWQLSGLMSSQTGHYFTVTVPNARTRLGATCIGDWWPDRVANPRLEERTANAWFDKNAFVLPQNPDKSWRIGNAGRAILNSDGPFNLDLGLMKAFPITERLRLQFRWETFNLTNTPTLGDPNSNVESPDFATSRGTTSTPRQMQFALRLEF